MTSTTSDSFKPSFSESLEMKESLVSTKSSAATPLAKNMLEATSTVPTVV
jgi:hypothetical protein